MTTTQNTTTIHTTVRELVANQENHLGLPVSFGRTMTDRNTEALLNVSPKEDGAWFTTLDTQGHQVSCFRKYGAKVWAEVLTSRQGQA